MEKRFTVTLQNIGSLKWQSGQLITWDVVLVYGRNKGFEHCNKQSKHLCSHKVNDKGNCCMQVLNGLYDYFLHN